TYLCLFGFNKSFASVAGEEKFREAYGKYLEEMAQQYPRPNGKPPRFVLISPTSWEPTDNPLWPDASKRNNDLRRYAANVARTAERRNDWRADRAAHALRQPIAALFRAGRAEISDAGRVRQKHAGARWFRSSAIRE